MTSLQFAHTSSLPARQAAPRRAAPLLATTTTTARADSLLVRLARSVARARIDWATGGRI